MHLSRLAAFLLVVTLVGLAAGGCARHDHDGGGTGVALTTCRLKGVETAMRCGTIDVPEDRDAADPHGRRLAIRFAVLPALAHKPERDAIFVLAGGPGQAATSIAGLVQPLFARLNRERDVVFVDQRGTGGSHRLDCAAETDTGSLADGFDLSGLDAKVAACAKRLSADADLTRFGTAAAMRDLDDVRAALGYPTIDLWGASYGTRAALAYAAQFPDRVRTMTLDGVAPPWQKLPLSFGVDTYATLRRLVDDCTRDAACARVHPTLGDDVAGLFARLARAPMPVDVPDPLTGSTQHVVVTTAGLATLLRTPLYVSLTASLLPAAFGDAARGDFAPLAALTSTVGSSLEDGIALGMHLSVLCAEDVATIDDAEAAAARAESEHSALDGRPNPFAAIYLEQYRRLCAAWPVRRPVAAATVPRSTVPTLLLSGGLDPATPPVHAERVAATLQNARHVVAPNVGHGVSMQGCAPDLIERFVRDADPKAIDGACLATIPRPPFYAPIVASRRADDATKLP